MALEFSDNDTPETATNSLVIGPTAAPNESLWGNVGGGDAVDFHAVNVEPRVQTITLASLGLWFTQQFRHEPGVVNEIRSLTLTPVQGLSGPTITATARYGANAYEIDSIFQGLVSNVGSWKFAVEYPYAVNRTLEEAMAILELVEQGESLFENALADKSGADAAAGQLEAIASQLDAANVPTADLYRRAAAELRALSSVEITIDIGGVLHTGSGLLPLDTPDYELADNSTKGIFEITGGVIVFNVTKGELSDSWTSYETRPLGYELNAAWSSFSEDPGSIDGDDEDNFLAGSSSNDTINGLAGNDTLLGNLGNDRLIGGLGNDTLNGGAGIDFMLGGAGNDVYVVDNVRDNASEVGGSGVDRVLSSVTYTLGAGLEKLTLTGAAALRGTGNASANTIVGNLGANVLNGVAGNDILNGGAGNDVLLGGAGNDTLTGGAGRDVLTGGIGFDAFRFDAPLVAANADVIADFNVPQDTMQLDNLYMKGLGAKLGALSATMFWKSAAGVAHDANDRIIYDTNGGQLYYDANGNVAGGAVLIATLKPGLAITAADFVVV